MSEYIFSSESVGEGHPDKVAGTISDAILDACLAQDRTSRVACETFVKSNVVVVGGSGWDAASETVRSATDLRGGEASAQAAEPGDTLVVFGGHAEIQLASGLPSPYPYLWSLPMRTLDPEYAELRALLASTRAP